MDRISPSVQCLAAIPCMRSANDCFAAVSLASAISCWQAPELFQVAATGLATSSFLVALDCVLDLKQLGIVGMYS